MASSYHHDIYVRSIFSGREEKAIEDARLMRVKGYPIVDILEITGLSESQLRNNGIL
jgi:hypothetical protein